MNGKNKCRTEVTLPLWLNILAAGALAITALLVLTNALPLAQAGFVDIPLSKSRVFNIARIPVVLLAALGAAIYWLKREIWRELWIVRVLSNAPGRALKTGMWLLTLLYATSAIIIAWTRHAALETRAYDLGIFSQAVWTTLQGKLLLSSLKGNICLLGDHFSPVLFAAVPFYYFWPDPRTLLFLQAAAMAACIPVLFYFVKSLTGREGDAFIFAFALFLFYPPRAVLHEDFHPETLVEPLLFGALWALLAGRKIWFVVLSLIVMSGKENMAGIVFMLGIYTLLFTKMKRTGLCIAVFSFLYFFVVIKWVIPSLSGIPYHYGGSYRNLWEAPWALLAQLVSFSSIEYVFKVFFPVCFLSFAHPAFLLCLPVLMQNLFSSNELMRSFNFHYTLGLTPFVFASAALGFTRLERKFAWVHEHRKMILTLIVLASLLRTGPSEYYYYLSSKRASELPRNQMIHNALTIIEDKGSVLGHNGLLAQVPNRFGLYQFEYNQSPSKEDQIRKINPDYVLFDALRWENGNMPFERIVARMEDLGYDCVFNNDDFQIYRRKSF